MNMPDPKFLAAQLRRPSGEAARDVAERMSEHNQKLILQTYALFAPQAGEQLLEVGPGNGAYLEQLVQATAPGGHVRTLDYSLDMLRQSAELNQNFVAAGQLEIVQGNIASPPFANRMFDGICSINTLYFWEDPAGCLYECLRVLKPGGRLALGFRSKQAVANLPYTRHGFTLYSPGEAVSLLESSGFELMGLQRQSDAEVDAVSVLAVKPGKS